MGRATVGRRMRHPPSQNAMIGVTRNNPRLFMVFAILPHDDGRRSLCTSTF